MTEGPIFALDGIVKTFPGVRALDGVSFDCRAGEVHALVGENGAGKSTLMKVLSGVYRPDQGRITVEGQDRRFAHPQEAIAAGIAVIYQEFALLPDRTVADNIFLGREPTKGVFLDRRLMAARTVDALGMFGDLHRIAADTLVGDLSVAEQQMVEIAKAVSLDARVIVMDEPTSALDEHECEVLFRLIGTLRSQGRAIVYITHRMQEIDRIADRVTVIKDGRVTASFEDLPGRDAIVHAMVGRDLGEFYPARPEASERGQVLLRVAGGGNARLSGIDLDLRAGEIAGFAGIQGAGRSDLALALIGERPFETGTMLLDEAVVRFRNPREAFRAGVTILPGDRKAEGLFLMQSVRDNGMASARAFSSLLGARSRTRYGTLAELDALFEEVDMRAASLDQEIGSLSGGNQQKAVVARLLALQPRVLIFVEPTRGVDVNAKAGIYALMRDLAGRGAAIMMVSSDLPEVLGVSDRVIVMRDGTIVGELSPGASEADVMHLATDGAEVAA